jgi:ubiquinol-cytochrome c reductase cytochrome b subunit
LLEYFKGNMAIVGALVIPGVVLLTLILIPIFGRWKLGHRFNIGFTFALLIGIAVLTCIAFADDRHDQLYQASIKLASRDAERVKDLAQSKGIPPAGAVALLREDAYTQGPRIFARSCASCHRFDGHDGLGKVPTDPPTASDLKHFASREWLSGLLDPDKINSPHYFGGTKFADGKMAKWVKKNVAKYSPEQKEQLRKVITALSAEANLKSQQSRDAKDTAEISAGRELIAGTINCVECHQFHKADEEATAPDLTGYGSRDWLIAFMSNPAHERFYGKRNDRMPAFVVEKVLDTRSIEMVADWLRGEWFEAQKLVGRGVPTAPH